MVLSSKTRSELIHNAAARARIGVFRTLAQLSQFEQRNRDSSERSQRKGTADLDRCG